MKRSYCNDSDLNWGHNITDILNCGVECWKSQECFSFIFADNICQPKAAGCTLLEVGVKGSAFFKGN